jgi:LPXTG-motif cell wall-anchored protein
MGFLSDLWDAITSFLSQLWDALSTILVIVLIIIAIIYFPYLGISGMLGIGVSTAMSWAIFFACLVAAWLIDPELTSSLMNDVGNAISGVVGTLANIAGEVAATGISALLGSPIGLGVIAFGAWYFFRKKKENVVLLGSDDKDKKQKGGGYVQA